MNFIDLIVWINTIVISCDVQDSLLLKIENQENLVINDSVKRVKISLTISNATNDNLLLFGSNYNEIAHAFRLESDYCSRNIGAGITGFIFDNDGNQMFSEFSVSPDNDTDYVPVSSEDLDRAINDANSKLVNGKTIVESDNTIQVDKIYDLKNYDLESGQYKIHFIYHVGYRIRDQIDSIKISRIENEFHVRLFQGCIKSNSINLIVE